MCIITTVIVLLLDINIIIHSCLVFQFLILIFKKNMSQKRTQDDCSTSTTKIGLDSLISSDDKRRKSLPSFRRLVLFWVFVFLFVFSYKQNHSLILHYRVTLSNYWIRSTLYIRFYSLL